MMKKYKNLPLVSIIMPVYNAGDFLCPAIESIIKQTYKNWELIIVNDASLDNSLEIINKFKKKYPEKIKPINLKNNLNKGGDRCANLAFRQARGVFVARMDADDISHPQRLAKQVKFLQKNPDIFMVGSQAWVVNKKGELIGEKKVASNPQDIYNDFFVFHPIIHPSIMFRKTVIKTKDFYQIKYSANNDLFTFFRFLQTKKLANLEDKLLYYRVHGKNDSLTAIKEKYFNTLKIRIKAISKFGYKPTLKAVILNIGQLLTVVLLPERLLLNLYLLSKGIYSPEDILIKILKNIIPNLRYNKLLQTN